VFVLRGRDQELGRKGNKKTTWEIRASTHTHTRGREWIATFIAAARRYHIGVKNSKNIANWDYLLVSTQLQICLLIIFNCGWVFRAPPGFWQAPDRERQRRSLRWKGTTFLPTRLSWGLSLRHTHTRTAPLTPHFSNVFSRLNHWIFILNWSYLVAEIA